jgi:chromosome segregation ATPase
MPYVEPQLISFIEDSVALQLLGREKQSNQGQFEDLYQIYQEIIEDVLYALLEIGPLEARWAEMLKSFSNTTLTKLLERFELSQREEAALIAKYRAQLNNDVDDTTSLQTAVYEIEGSNRKLKNEIRTLDLQLKRTSLELEKEQSIVVEEIDPEDEGIVRGRKISEQLSEVNDQIAKGEQLKNELDRECLTLKAEIDSMMEELVAMNKRSIASVRKSSRSRK